MTYPRDRLKKKMEKNSGRVRCVITAGCQQGSSAVAWGAQFLSHTLQILKINLSFEACKMILLYLIKIYFSCIFKMQFNPFFELTSDTQGPISEIFAKNLENGFIQTNMHKTLGN